MNAIRQTVFLCATLFCASVALADEIKIEMFSVADGKSLGFVEAVDTPQGVLLTPHLSHLSPGLHGMHMHQNPSCGHQAADAGGHWDPKTTNSHQGPYGHGHLGDLPALYVDAQGNATLPVLAPHLVVKDFSQHSLMIHAGGDNYSDNPPMGGGGERIVCGAIS